MAPVRPNALPWLAVSVAVIVLDQLPKLLGVHIDNGSFFHNVGAILAEVPHTSFPTLAVGVGTLTNRRLAMDM